jgi:serine/threonine protein kinase
MGEMPNEESRRLEAAAERFRSAWQAGERPRIEYYLADVPELLQPELLAALLQIERELRRRAGEEPVPEEYYRRFRENTDVVEVAFGVLETPKDLVTPSGGMEVTPSGGEGVSVLRPGMVLLERYAVLELLGKGGMGSVWAVRLLASGEKRALKVLHSSIVGRPGFRARFEQSVQILASLKHPNAVVVYDAGIVGSLAYIEMEYLEGQTLHRRLKPGEPMPLEFTVGLLDQLCDVLQYASDEGIIHRDLKPSNMMLVEGKPGKNVLKVLDFEMSKMPEGVDDLHTVSGNFMGTPLYSSPEQIIGEKVDGRSDIYAVGLILYELLTGHRPSSGPMTAILFNRMTLPPPPFAKVNPSVRVPPGVEQVVMRCLEKDPRDRPQSALELSNQLRNAIGAMQTQVERPMLEERVPLADSTLAAPSASKPKGLFMGLLAWFGRSVKKAVVASWSAAGPGLGLKTVEKDELLPTRDAPATIRRRVEVSFPTQVLAGKLYHLMIQLVPAQGDLPGGSTRERPGAHGDDWTMQFLVSFISSAPPAATLSPRIKVTVSVVAENFKLDGSSRAELVVPREGNSPVIQFSLQGLDVGAGRVMIDFSQGGRPVGSMDLAPEVVAALDVKGPATLPACPLESLILNLATGPIPAPPDLVIKVFEHRLAGVPGRLQFVLSSTHRELSDLPVLDGDLGTLDLRTEVADWVGEQLRALGTLARQPDVSAEEAEQTLAHIGCNLFQQLLPPALQQLCWSFRQRGVRTMMILSDEPHIPWELIKPFRVDPTIGAVVAEHPFWGECFALTHWLRGRPPAPQLSMRRAVTMAAGSDLSQVRPEKERGRGSMPGFIPAGVGSDMIRDMIVTTSAPTAAVVEDPSQTASGPRSVEEPPLSAPGPEAGLPALASAEEELELLRFLESLGAKVTRLPARWKALQTIFEQGEFDLLHVATHSTFGGTSSGDASAVMLDDGVFTAAQLSPLMAGPLRRCAPLIFFNTCHSGRLGFCPTRLGAWGARLVELGCGGFIGALWPVTDRAAMAFARAFYDLIAQRRPIGEAIQLSRLQVRERFPNDPTWLAYCCFADTMAQIEPLHGPA